MNKMRDVSSTGMNIINRFTNSLEGRNLNQRTLQEYAADIKHFMGWHEYGGMEVCKNPIKFSFEQITTSELQAYLNAMKMVSEHKPSTINRRLSTLKLFFDWAYHAGISKRTPAKHIKLLTIPKTIPRVIESAEEKRLLDAVKAHGPLRDQAIIKLMIHTGLRVGEACALKHSDVTLNSKNGFVIVGPEGQRRSIPLNSVCRSIFERYMSKVNPTSEYFFPSEKTGEQLSERALRHILKKYLDLAGLEGLSAYSLRHNFGYRKAASTPVHKLAHIMGHNNLNTTLTYMMKKPEKYPEQRFKVIPGLSL